MSSVPVEAVPEEKRAVFLRRLKACELYCAGKLGAQVVRCAMICLPLRRHLLSGQTFCVNIRLNIGLRGIGFLPERRR